MLEVKKGSTLAVWETAINEFPDMARHRSGFSGDPVSNTMWSRKILLAGMKKLLLPMRLYAVLLLWNNFCLWVRIAACALPRCVFPVQ